MTPRRVWGIAGIILGIVCGIAMFGLAVTGFTSQTVFSSPGPVTTNLAMGRWTVFELLPTDTTAVLPEDIAAQRKVSVEQVKVTGPDGKNVAVSCGYCGGDSAGAMPVDLRLANPIANFDASLAGNYTITIEKPPATAVTMAVANPLHKLEELMPWLLLLGLAGTVSLVAGIVLVIFGGNRKGPTGAPPMGPPSPPVMELTPPGWYPNPYHPDTDSQMWWDGKQWTSNWR